EERGRVLVEGERPQERGRNLRRGERCSAALSLVGAVQPTRFLQGAVEKAPLSEDNVRYFGQQLLEGLKYIHEAGVTHCDLKPQNVLVASGMLLKISDFGLSEYSELAGKRFEHQREFESSFLLNMY
ncbi:hypothetical protein EC991_000836, partial [Linnemannia zychae]